MGSQFSSGFVPSELRQHVERPLARVKVLFDAFKRLCRDEFQNNGMFITRDQFQRVFDMDVDEAHRHFSGLFALYPGRQLSPLDDADGAVGNDTGPMHIFAAQGCRTLVLYSNASDPALCAQRGDTVTILRRERLQDLSVKDVAAALSVVNAGPLS